MRSPYDQACLRTHHVRRCYNAVVHGVSGDFRPRRRSSPSLLHGIFVFIRGETVENSIIIDRQGGAAGTDFRNGSGRYDDGPGVVWHSGLRPVCCVHCVLCVVDGGTPPCLRCALQPANFIMRRLGGNIVFTAIARYWNTPYVFYHKADNSRAKSNQNAILNAQQ